MPRPTFPHTLQDILHAVDGPLGLVVGDMPDGRIWVLKRGRKTGDFTLTQWSDAGRTEKLSEEVMADRVVAVNTLAAAIGLPERLR